jgi:hypothetical protein
LSRDPQRVVPVTNSPGQVGRRLAAERQLSGLVDVEDLARLTPELRRIRDVLLDEPHAALRKERPQVVCGHDIPPSLGPVNSQNTGCASHLVLPNQPSLDDGDRAQHLADPLEGCHPGVVCQPAGSFGDSVPQDDAGLLRIGSRR